MNAIKVVITALFLVSLNLSIVKSGYAQTTEPDDGQRERTYLVQSLIRVADPVLTALSQHQLRKLMPVEARVDGRQNFTYLEAFGRLFAGIAPWLELGADDTPEGKLRKKYIDLTIQALHNATDPKSADFMNFNKGGQALVDAAFLAQGLLRSPKQIWGQLDAQTKVNIIAALKSTRVLSPGYNNWLLFSAEVEAALLKFDGYGDRMRMDYAIKSHMNWYKGDGTYGDGPNFHWDYYNSFVIQPMLLDVTRTILEIDHSDGAKKVYNSVLQRSKRYATIQERMISPEGTYPPIGRSLAYRFGAFQLLSQVALMKALPDEIQPQQVRAALYTVIKRQLEAPGTFDANGWLQIGLYGHQPDIGEGYISTGSLYLCSEAFLVLGLPPMDRFWTGDDVDWTAKKIWQGENFPADHAED
ncbi:DUF2264 domain-containing protein [Parapedobacter indicus]|uniref:DUF2264 domain-containing protein n=1 Tax=Parapedobacter indicus TaxID=1477437 RepID=A0A1I3VTV0_9SPHI|nr:DUF2264 domain-containing protein [Parapedobacter indicus]PPL04211.1 hypothetical protein CLV26_10112 [Parapedobacter indicus]SFJ97707.1 hypothetical protein SAMN05444682_1223 [Parapedobacter indicus]